MWHLSSLSLNVSTRFTDGSPYSARQNKTTCSSSECNKLFQNPTLIQPLLEFLLVKALCVWQDVRMRVTFSLTLAVRRASQENRLCSGAQSGRQTLDPLQGNQPYKIGSIGCERVWNIGAGSNALCSSKSNSPRRNQFRYAFWGSFQNKNGQGTAVAWQSCSCA